MRHRPQGHTADACHEGVRSAIRKGTHEYVVPSDVWRSRELRTWSACASCHTCAPTPSSDSADIGVQRTIVDMPVGASTCLPRAKRCLGPKLYSALWSKRGCAREHHCKSVAPDHTLACSVVLLICLMPECSPSAPRASFSVFLFLSTHTLHGTWLIILLSGAWVWFVCSLGLQWGMV